MARRIDWETDSREPSSGLTFIDDDEVDEIGVTLPVEERRTIESGWAFAVMGREFAQDLEDSDVVCSDDVLLVPVPNETYAIGLVTVELFERFREAIFRKASMIFDKALGSKVGPDLCSKGRAALRVLRHVSHRQSDLAVRELAGAIVSRDFDLFRRLLSRYSIELEGESQEGLEYKAYRHIRLCKLADVVASWTLDLNRAKRPIIDYEVNWEQMKAAQLIPRIRSQLDGVRKKKVPIEVWNEALSTADTRGVGVHRKPWLVPIKRTRFPSWNHTVDLDVNRRRTVVYIEKEGFVHGSAC